MAASHFPIIFTFVLLLKTTYMESSPFNHTSPEMGDLAQIARQFAEVRI